MISTNGQALGDSGDGSGCGGIGAHVLPNPGGALAGRCSGGAGARGVQDVPAAWSGLLRAEASADTDADGEQADRQ